MPRRCFISPLPTVGTVVLRPGAGHHLGRVVHTSVGDAIVLFDGQGREQDAEVLAVSGRELTVALAGEPRPATTGWPRLPVDVACGMPRRADWLLAHGAEVGIRGFYPLLSERTNRRPGQRAGWRDVLIRACAQSGRAELPELHPAVTVSELCGMDHWSARFVAGFGGEELGPLVSGSALLVIGPEGGLNPIEMRQLLDAGFASRSLGPLTLRTETAVVAGSTRLLQSIPGSA